MSVHDSPSFEDLEPEGEDIEMGDEEGDSSLEYDEFDDFLSADTRDDKPDPYDAFDEFDDAFDGQEPSRQRPRRTRGRSTARSKRPGASHAASAAIAANGHAPASRKQTRLSEKAWRDIDTEDVDDLFDDTGREMNMCSAALREDQELMNTLAATAAAAKDEVVAEGMMAALVPLSLRFSPTVYRALWPALPALIEEAVGLMRLLHARPSSRRRITAIPMILQRTTAQLARQVSQGRPVTRQAITKVFARQANAMLRR